MAQLLLCKFLLFSPCKMKLCQAPLNSLGLDQNLVTLIQQAQIPSWKQFWFLLLVSGEELEPAVLKPTRFRYWEISELYFLFTGTMRGVFCGKKKEHTQLIPYSLIFLFYWNRICPHMAASPSPLHTATEEGKAIKTRNSPCFSNLLIWTFPWQIWKWLILATDLAMIGCRL